MKKLKRVIALFLVSIMMLGIMGCTKKDSRNADKTDTGKTEQGKTDTDKPDKAEPTESTSILTEPGTYPIVKEPIEMTMFRVLPGNIENFDTNDFTKFMEEKTGIKMKFETGSIEDWETKLNLSLTTDDYPDIIWYQNANRAKYGVKEGIFIQLDEYLNEKYLPNYMSAMGKYLDATRETDGHFYSLASLNECYHCQYAKKMWVNTYWLEKMGVEVPTTTDEFYEVCKKFIEINPDGIAIAGANNGWHVSFEEFLINSFTFEPGKTQNYRDKTAVTKDGRVVTIANTEKYKNALEYMNSLYKLGAVYDGNFTQDSDQLRTLANQKGEPILFLPSGTLTNVFDVIENNETYRHYQAMSPLAGPDGTRNTTYLKYAGLEEGAFIITDKCKYPEAALRWADYFFTNEGTLSAYYGAEEGKDWVMNPEGKVGLNGEPALYDILNPYSGEIQNHDWQDVSISYRPAEFRLGQATDINVDIGTLEGLEKLLYDVTKEKMEPYAQNGDLDILPRLKLTDEEYTRIQTIGVEIENYIDENKVAFITGSKSLEKDWDAYVKGFDNIGLPTLLEVYQTAYNRQSGR